MSGSRKFCQRGLKFDNIFVFVVFFVVDEVIEDPNITINMPLSVQQGNTI